MLHIAGFRRAVMLAAALALPLGLGVEQAGAAVPAASHSRTAHAGQTAHIQRPMTLSQRRAQVRQDLSAAHVAAMARQVDRIPGKRRTGAPSAIARKATTHKTPHGDLRTGYLAAPATGSGAAGPRARAGASPAATSSINGWVEDSWITGPNGLLSGDCYDECPPNTSYNPPATGSGFIGEQVTANAEAWNFDPSGATHQVQVSWSLECNANQYVPLTSKTVAAPSSYSNASDGTFVQAAITVSNPVSACAANGYNSSAGSSAFYIAVDGTVTDVSNGGDGGGNAVAFSLLSVPVQQIAGPACTDSIGGGGGLAQVSGGDPVDTATGECNEVATDAALHGPGYPLAVTRSYSSALAAAGPLGPGWTLPWFASASPQPSGDVIITAENGDQYDYASNSNSGFTTPPGTRSVLAQQSSGNYVLTAPDHHTLTFSSSGQLLSMDDRTGRGLTMSYTGSQLTGITDAAGHSVSLSYTGSLLTQISLPSGATVNYGYTNGYLTTATNPDSNTITYGYDSSGRLNSIQDADGNYEVRNTYDSSNRVIQQQDGMGAITKFSYTALSNGETETDVTDPNGGIWTHVYGGNVLMESIDPAGDKTLYVFNVNLQPVQVTDPLGNITQMGYDSNGNLTSVTDPLNHEQQWAYDSNNNLTTYTDRNNNATNYSYNAMSEVTSVTTQNGGEITYNYDSSGNLTSSVDPRGNVSGGNPAAYTTNYTYNSSQQLTSATSPDSGKTTYTYDAMGYPLTITDPMGRVTTYGYDNDERQTSATAPDGGVTKSVYDQAGNLTSQTDANGNTYTYAYDADNRVVKATDPLNNSVAYGYDGPGNQTTFTDARGITTTTSYDANNRPTKITYSDGTPAVSYVYDADGHPTSVTDATGTRTMSHNAAGELTSAAGPGTGSFSYGYDPAGNVTARSYPDGTQISYTYNSDGQIASLTSGSATTQYSYDPAGNLVSTTEPNGVTESRSYDNAGQLTGITDAKGSSTLDSYGLTLNSDGQPTQVAVTQASTAQATRYYTYDSAGRLASACYSTSGSSACSAASAGTGTGTATDPAAPLGAITSGETGICLDDAGNSGAAGNKVDISKCAGSASQGWTIANNGTVQVAGGCLTVTGGGTASGTTVELDPCTSKNTAQQWRAEAGSALVNPISGKCLDDPGASTTSGTQADIATCSGAAQQEWGLPGTNSGLVTNGVTGECANDSGSGTTAGTKVVINTCNGSTGAQKWTAEANGTIQIHGLCLEPAGAGTTQNTGLVLENCTGITAQEWAAGPTGWLWNINAGMCASDPNASTTNGTQLIIAGCGSNTQQTWRLPPVRPNAGVLANGVSGECADNSGGTKAVIWSCNSTGAQQWVLGNDGNIRTVSGLCLQLSGGSTSVNTVIALAACGGAADEQWAAGPGPASWITSTDANLCLSDPNASTTNGTQLIIAGCSSTASQQHWKPPATTAPWTPTGVSATAAAGAATVSWTPASGGGDPLTGYTVTASPGGATATAGPYDTSATVAGLTSGTAYTVTVTVTSAAGTTTTAATTAVTPGNQTTYSYDKTGNITSSQTDGLTTTNSYNAAEQLTKAVTGNTTLAYGYDANGNQTTAGNQTYSYNGAGQLSKAGTPAGTFTYTYDSGGNLSATGLNGSLIQGTRWDTNNTLPMAAEETNASGATTADYVYSPAGYLASLATTSGTSYAITDWLGSVTGLVSSAGTQLTSTTFSPYGTASTTNMTGGAPVSSIGYAGSYTQPGGTGLDDMRARDYNPSSATFTSVDPMLPATGQAYTYTDGDPVTNTDPGGSITCPSWLPGCGIVTNVQNGISGAIGRWLQQWQSGWSGQILCTAQSGGVFVTTPRGVTYKIPDGWIPRVANNGRGIVFQEPGAEGNDNSIRIMEPNSQNPNGYVTIYNSKGQPLDSTGSPGNPAGRSATHIPEEELGDFPELPIP
jgi:RHS repeat-associated protein